MDGTDARDACRRRQVLAEVRRRAVVPAYAAATDLAALAQGLGWTEAEVRDALPDDQSPLAAAFGDALTQLILAIAADQQALLAADPVTRFRALGVSYILWGMDHPEEAQLIATNQALLPGVGPILAQYNYVVAAMTGEVLEAARVAGRIAPGIEPADIASAARIYAMGLVHLLNAQQLQLWNPDLPARAIVERTVDHFIATNFLPPPG